jgi:acetyl esterase/lipase
VRRAAIRTLGVVVSSLALAGCSSGGGSSAQCDITGPVGSGREAVWLLRPADAARSIVVFAHGWTAVEPTDWHRVRLDHLCANGSLVVFPRYQVDGADTFELGVDGFRSGVRTAFAQLEGMDVPVVAVGYSFGGALVNYYASQAASWGVPGPRSVLSIFPTPRVTGRAIGTPPSSIEYTLLAGDRDEVVGTAGAEDLLAWLESNGVEHATYRLVLSTSALSASHEALKEMTDASTETFWDPVDELVEDVVGSG